MHILKHQNKILQQLTSKCDDVANIKIKISDIIPHSLKKHCNLTDIQGNTFIFSVQTSAEAARFRLSMHEISKEMINMGIRENIKIKCIIIPKSNINANKPSPKRGISPTSKELLKVTAENIKSKKLSEAILKMINQKEE